MPLAVLREENSDYAHRPKLVISDRFWAAMIGPELPPDSPWGKVDITVKCKEKETESNLST